MTKGNDYMVTVTDPLTAIISGLAIICCVLVSRSYWKTRNTDAFVWVMVTLFWYISIYKNPLRESKWEKFRTDEKPYNDIYHKMEMYVKYFGEQTKEI